MKPLFLVAAVCMLMACTEKSAWTVERTDLYRVSGYSHGVSRTVQAPHMPYFLVKKVAGLPDSAMFKDVVQYQIVWCKNQSNCNDRDYSLQVVQYRSASEGNRITFESGAKCTIISHSLAGDQITIKSDVYTSKQFSPEECESGVSAPLPSKFVLTSSKTITGQLVQRTRDES